MEFIRRTCKQTKESWDKAIILDKILKVSGVALECFKLTQCGWLRFYCLCSHVHGFSFSIDFTPTSPRGDHKVVAYDVICAQGPSIVYPGGN